MKYGKQLLNHTINFKQVVKKTIEELKKCNKRLQKSAGLDINKENVSVYTSHLWDFSPIKI